MGFRPVPIEPPAPTADPNENLYNDIPQYIVRGKDETPACSTPGRVSPVVAVHQLLSAVTPFLRSLLPKRGNAAPVSTTVTRTSLIPKSITTGAESHDAPTMAAPAISFLAGFFLIYIGINLAGSFYGPVSGQFHGIYATIFYQYQIGSIVLFSGVYFMLNAATRYAFKS